MTARDLLKEAAQRGLLIIPDGTNLRIRPGQLVTPDLAERLRARKAELLALLADQKAPELVKPHRPLTQREWTILVQAGAENDLIVITALNLFNAKVVG
jgi:TubC N-terminal docking domain